MKVRIGIDVGGTFTDAVVINNETGEIIAKEKIPTTHYDESGVAGGIILIINKILNENSIKPDDVVFIAHGTTQATNALLEGDVAKVGLVGIGASAQSKKELHFNDIELAENRFLHVECEYIEDKHYSLEEAKKRIGKLQELGCEVIVISEAFSIDDPSKELEVLEYCKEQNIYATCGHEISQLYGLKVRTRTAIVNGSLIPKMMETANMTEKVVKEVGIKSELMIMRADGGVMSINEVRKRPILTMLSGLAAGVAGALMYEKVTDGIFFEVGGTSIDISIIKDGKVIIKNAEVGGNKTYLKSLDVRTLAIAGGSMIRVENHDIKEVGPRSAHLAHKEYENFTDPKNISNPEVTFIAPLKDDPEDYTIIKCDNGKEYALTLAGAANILGYVPEGDYAYADKEASVLAWEALAKYCGKSVEELARKAMDIACEKVYKTVREMIHDYELNHDFITLVGGGGSASVTTQALADKYNYNYKIANNAPFISTIGVAMAMIREQIERSIINPTNEDIRKLRQEITSKIIDSGANEETVEVSIEVDQQKNIVTATATGATEFKAKDFNAKELQLSELTEIVASSVMADSDQVNLICSAGKWKVFEVNKKTKAMFGLMSKNKKYNVVSTKEGVVSLRKENSRTLSTNRSDFSHDILPLVDEMSQFTDAGQTIPKIYIFHGTRMHDYSGLQNVDQVLSMMAMDLEFVEPNEEIIMLAERK